jgi:hypothetical protein
MVDLNFKELWTPTGLLLGFQVTFFKWRLEEEARVGSKGSIPWLVPSDYVGVIGMISFVLGVVLLPVAGLIRSSIVHWAFGLGTLLFIGQILGLAGHYQLYNRSEKRQFVWFPLQERIAVAITLLVGLVYSVVFFTR